VGIAARLKTKPAGPPLSPRLGKKYTWDLSPLRQQQPGHTMGIYSTTRSVTTRLILNISMLEKQIQKKIIEYSKKNQILSFKVDSTSTRGFPDLTVILPNGTVLFVELKTDKGRLTKLQQHVHDKLKRNNANVYIARSLDEFKQLVNTHAGTAPGD